MSVDVGKVFDLVTHLTKTEGAALELVRSLLISEPELVIRTAGMLSMGSVAYVNVHDCYGNAIARVTEAQCEEITRLCTGVVGQPAQKVEAIKRLRALTGVGLKESKDAVEAWAMAAQLVS